MGTPDLARVVLAALCDCPSVEVRAVVSQPDKPVGRKLELTPPPTKMEALARGLPVLQPLKARDPAFVEQLRATAPELIVVAAYGQILPQALLDVPRFGCLNVHTSLLPRWRGAAPIQWAIAEGDAETGICIMRMEAGLDTGPIISVARTRIADEDNGQILHDRLAAMGAKLLLETIPGYIAGTLIPQVQPAEGVTYARKISKEDGRLVWSNDARVLWNRLRAFTPWPGAFCQLPAEPQPLLMKIHKAGVVEGVKGSPGQVIPADGQVLLVACGKDALRLEEVQVEGGRRMSASQFLAGRKPESFL
jgi:methionyl-tRNA formyltransferase